MGLSQTCEIKLKNKFQRGNRNLITDIPGVRVGQVTLQNAEKSDSYRRNCDIAAWRKSF